MPQEVLIQCKLNIKVKPLYLAVKADGSLMVQNTSHTFIVYRPSDPPGPYHRPNPGYVHIADKANSALIGWGSDRASPSGGSRTAPKAFP
jgi:hypothetical protein